MGMHVEDNHEFDPSERARIRRALATFWGFFSIGWLVVAYLLILWAQGNIDIQRHQPSEPVQMTPPAQIGE
ncbi:unnamed protein product [marine sediment metagenome]|uniref:Uncharacterized protein n=1 Tax=marine sediment metagenome TaxID=412755 RepID=X0SND4_9ZZZZ